MVKQYNLYCNMSPFDTNNEAQYGNTGGGWIRMEYKKKKIKDNATDARMKTFHALLLFPSVWSPSL